MSTERFDIRHAPAPHAFLQQFRVAESDCGKLFGSEIPVTEHPLETVHIDVCDVAHHQGPGPDRTGTSRYALNPWCC